MSLCKVTTLQGMSVKTSFNKCTNNFFYYLYLILYSSTGLIGNMATKVIPSGSREKRLWRPSLSQKDKQGGR